MLVAERHREIVSLVEKEGSVRVTELARLFNVTEETIRRDLERLELDGKLQRSHGGAVTIQEEETETPFSQREISHVEEKIQIAREALHRIQEGDTILLDASTSAWQLARMLPDMYLTVLTNSIKVAMELAAHQKTRVISTGGALLPSSLSFIGPQAERFLEEYRVDKLFLSCQGLDFRRGLSDSNEWQANLKQRMISIADKRYLLVDHSKFQTNSLTVFGKLQDIDEVITDCHVDDALLVQLQASGVNKISIA